MIAPGLSRRSLLLGTLSVGGGGALVAAIGAVLDFLTPRGIEGPGGMVRAGNVGSYPPGTKTFFAEGKFWLVSLTEEQGGPGILALEAKCTHIGCTLPWRETFSFYDAATGVPREGWSDAHATAQPSTMPVSGSSGRRHGPWTASKWSSWQAVRFAYTLESATKEHRRTRSALSPGLNGWDEEGRGWCQGPDLNRRPQLFQSCALPTELPWQESHYIKRLRR